MVPQKKLIVGKKYIRFFYTTRNYDIEIIELVEIDEDHVARFDTSTSKRYPVRLIEVYDPDKVEAPLTHKILKAALKASNLEISGTQ